MYLNTVKTDATAVFDEKWTLEAFCNIVDNAIKYTVTGGISINVIVYEFVRIDISDTGIVVYQIMSMKKVFKILPLEKKANTTEGVRNRTLSCKKDDTGENGYIKVSSLPEHGSTFFRISFKTVSFILCSERFFFGKFICHTIIVKSYRYFSERRSL